MRTQATSFAIATTAPNATIDLYKGLGRKQCEAGGETLDTLRAQLTRAGVTPICASNDRRRGDADARIRGAGISPTRIIAGRGRRGRA